MRDKFKKNCPHLASYHFSQMTLTFNMYFTSALSCLFFITFVSRVSSFAKQPDSLLLTRLNLQGKSEIPAFFVTQLEQGLIPKDFSSFDPNEQRVPVILASKPSKPDDRRPVESRVHFTVHNKTKILRPKIVTSSPSPVTETYTTVATATVLPTMNTFDESSSESSSYNSFTKTSSYSEPKIPLLLPVRKSSKTYQQPGGNTIMMPPSYVPSDVYTIESSTKYRPRNLHSNSIFYQKALSFVKQYKDVLAQNRPQGPTYRPNTDTDNPQHVVSAYGEIPPVVFASHDTPYTPESSSTSNAYAAPASYRPAMREASPIPAPATEDNYDVGQINQQDALPIQGEDKTIIGYLPVITLPKKGKLYLPASVSKMTTAPATSGSKSSNAAASSSSYSRPSSSMSAPTSRKKYASSSQLLSPSLRIRAKNQMGSYRSSSSSNTGDSYASSSSVFRERFVPLLRISIKPSSSNDRHYD